MTRLRAIVTSLLVGGIALWSYEAAAQVSERTLRWAQQNSLEHPQGQGAKKFADLVEQKSGGKIKVRIFPSGQLGGDIQNVSALQGGTLDLMVLNAGLLVGIVKDFAVLDLPFLFNTPEEADSVVDGADRQEALRQAAGERARRPRIFRARLPELHEQPAPDRETGGLPGPEAPRPAIAAVHRARQHSWRQRRADAVPGGVHGAWSRRSSTARRTPSR